jgi:hypothetical protein
MNRFFSLSCAVVFVSLPISARPQTSPAQPQTSPAQAQPASADKGADPAQSFISPLGLGTGATLAVTKNGANITAAIARQVINPAINFWQVGFSGTTNTNGQAEPYSSQEADAPEFKAKLGLGKSSFIKYRPIYTATAGEVIVQAWCRDIVGQVNKSLPDAGQIKIDSPVHCQDAVELELNALKATPPIDDSGKVDAVAVAFDQKILASVAAVADNQKADDQVLALSAVCNQLGKDKNASAYVPYCPGGKSYKSTVDQASTAYPGLESLIKGAPSEFEWKVWATWAPVLTSTPYRPVVNGVANLSDKLNWTKLLNTGVGDIALYYGSLALGLEGGYGKTVQIKDQNVCNNTTSGTYTAQQCSMAMVGEPVPKNSWVSSTTLQVAPLPLFGKGAAISSVAQVLFGYVAPVAGGHSSELAAPLYVSPSVSRMSFVVGVQPTWDWNTDPTVGNKISVLVFVGARPSITTY